MKITEKTGNLVAIKDVNDTDDLMIINKSGITIRLRMSDLRTIGRATQGVRLIKISANDEISSVAKVAAEEKEEETEAVLVTTIEEGGAQVVVAFNGAENETLAADADEADETDDELEDDSDDETDLEDEPESDDLA